MEEKVRERCRRWLAVARVGNAVGWGVAAWFQSSAEPGANLAEAFAHPDQIEAGAGGRPVEYWRAVFRKARERLDEAEEEMRDAERIGAKVIDVEDAGYPWALARIADPPPALFVLGALAPRDARAVAVVGARAATEYGSRTARRIAGGLAMHGVTIVSGMAKGVDAHAHRGALDAGGRTLAVLGTGIDVPYPPQSRDLYERVPHAGAVVSEMPPGSPAWAGCFLPRNRIVSGLSRALVVVEAREKSGTSNTVAHATAQGRMVFAVPGDVDQARSAGTNRLLVEGATPARDAADVLYGAFDELYRWPQVDADDAPPLDARESLVLGALDGVPRGIPEILARTRLPVSPLLVTLSGLERKGLVQRDAIGCYARFGK